MIAATVPADQMVEIVNEGLKAFSPAAPSISARCIGPAKRSDPDRART